MYLCAQASRHIYLYRIKIFIKSHGSIFPALSITKYEFICINVHFLVLSFVCFEVDDTQNIPCRILYFDVQKN